MRIRDTGHDGKVSVAGRINVYIRGEHGAAAFVDGGDTLNFPLLLMQVCQKGVQQERDAFFLPQHLKIDLLEDFRLNGRNGFRDAERIGNMTEGTAAMRKTVHDFLREAPDHLMDAGKYLYGRVTGGDIGEKADPDLSWVEIYIAVYMQD